MLSSSFEDHKVEWTHKFLTMIVQMTLEVIAPSRACWFTVTILVHKFKKNVGLNVGIKRAIHVDTLFLLQKSVQEQATMIFGSFPMWLLL